MKKRKTGFTLIELLAVIVILAIIALIATPIILNIIEKARKEAFVDTAYGIINAAELQYTEGIMDNKVEEKLYTFPQTGSDKLKFSGAEPKGGDIKISSTGKVSIAVHNGDYCITKEENETEVKVEEYTGECSLESALVYTPEECFTFDEETGTIIKYDKDNDICGVDVVIPESIHGVMVKSIGEWAFVQNTDIYADDSKKIVRVVFPSGIESIGDYAFRGYVGGDYWGATLNKITELDFSRAVKLKTIGSSAFSTNQLTSVTIPSSVTSIEFAAFRSNQLTSVTIKGKSSSVDFTTYEPMWGWAEGYSDSNIIWNG